MNSLDDPLAAAMTSLAESATFIITLPPMPIVPGATSSASVGTKRPRDDSPADVSPLAGVAVMESIAPAALSTGGSPTQPPAQAFARKSPLAAPAMLRSPATPPSPSAPSRSLPKSPITATPPTLGAAAVARPASVAAPPQRSPFAERIFPRIASCLAQREAGAAPVPTAQVEPVARAVAEALARLGGSVAGDRARTLVAYLDDVKNHELRRQVRDGVITPQSLVEMNEHDLANPEEKQQAEELRAEKNKARNIQALKAARAMPSALFKCPRCFERRCTFSELQTASGDEPTTKFITCLVCEYNWKTR